MSSCPTSSDFEEYDAGLLDKAAAESLRAHLESCSRCKAAYEQHRRDAELLSKIRGGDLSATASILPDSKGDSSPIVRAAAQLPRIEGYRITGVIGQGGMGIVYRAVQTKLKRTVALKVLPAIVGSANPAAVARFRREATAAARLHHTNIVPIYDFGESPDAYYYAMELVEGQPLDVVIKRLAARNAPNASPVQFAELLRASTAEEMEPVSAAARPEVSDRSSGSGLTAGSSSTGRGRAYYRHAARWMADAADALHYAHEQSIIHRDIKPGNLLITVDGRVVIADFGLARSTEEQSVTMTGSLLGTLRYLSPEQAMAKRVRVDHRTDIYSLGTTMYELLTFQPAFTGEDEKEILGAIIARNPVAPRKIVSGIPRELETICLKAMEKLPDARYATARALAEDLRRFNKDEPIVAKRPGPLVRLGKLVRRHKARTFGVAACALLIVTAGLLFRTQQRRIRAEIDAGVREAVRLQESKDYAAATEAYNKVLQIDPRDFRALGNLAMLKKDQFLMQPCVTADPSLLRESVKLCDSAFLVHERSGMRPDRLARLYNGYAVSLYLLHRLEEAEDACRQAIELDPTLYNARSNLGRVLALQGRIDEASKEVAAGAELAGRNPHDLYAYGVYRTLGTIQLHLGRSEALQPLEHAIASRNRDAGSWLMLAKLRLQLEGFVDCERALDDAKQADSRADPPDPRIKRILALAYLHNDQFDKAICNAEEAIELGDMPTINHLILAVGHARIGEERKAGEHLSAGGEAWPEDLTEPGQVRVSADRTILWFDTTDELLSLRAEAGRLITQDLSPP
jgi:serine/threonine protein kinase/Tfp pilus assembly protein PilF